jgi:hypothetical protein
VILLALVDPAQGRKKLLEQVAVPVQRGVTSRCLRIDEVQGRRKPHAWPQGATRDLGTGPAAASTRMQHDDQLTAQRNTYGRAVGGLRRNQTGGAPGCHCARPVRTRAG